MTIIESVLSVFTAMMNWFVSAFSSVTPIFYDNDGLTFVGVITVITVAIAISCLVIAMVRSLLKLRG